MPRPSCKLALLAIVFVVPSTPAFPADPLHVRIDALIAARANGQAPSAPADDGEFLRRVYLDLAGRIPSSAEARAFLQDGSADKRARLITQLLSGPDYPRRMQELFHVMLMERLGDNADWAKYLRSSFEANKPWDQLAREILRGVPTDDATRGAPFFYTKRLENYGQNPVDYPALTRDVGRLFLGMDLRCAQCHNHVFIKDYKQLDFQGLHSFFQNTFLVKGKGLMVGEKPTTQKTAFTSVLTRNSKETGPRVPGRSELEIPVLEKGKEYVKPPDKKTAAPGELRFSPLAKLAEQLPSADNPAFSRNIVNRLWWVMMGRGLVHPLDLHHSENPPSHPELLDLLAKEFVEHKFDIKWLLGELALSQTYQRSSVLPKGNDKLPPESFLAANEKRMSAEQLMWSVLEATGEKQRVLAARDVKSGPPLTVVQQKFIKAFASPRREPEDEISPSLKGALFVLNDDAVLSWLTPRPGNLVERLEQLTDNDKAAEELYLSVLTRLPTAEERKVVTEYLARNGERRTAALGHLAWALLASTEFEVNH